MKLYIVVFTLLLSNFIFAQAPAVVIQTGLTAAFSKDEVVTPSGHGHYGWMLGVDGRILEGDIYFILGGQYHQSSLVASTKPEFFTKNNWKTFMGRCGLGMNVYRLSEQTVLRTKLLASVNFILDAPSNGLDIPNYEKLNDSYLGAVTGVGITIGFIDIDLDYQYGIINAYNKQSNTTFSSWTLMAGLHF